MIKRVWGKMLRNRFIYQILTPTLFIPALLFTLIGCEPDKEIVGPDPDDPGNRSLIKEMDNVELDEDENIRIAHFELTSPGKVEIVMNLREWDEDYQLELLLFSPSNYTLFTTNEYSCDTDWHDTILNRGEEIFVTSTLGTEYSYHLVIDNSDRGYRGTDFDFSSDDARFDIALYYLDPDTTG